MGLASVQAAGRARKSWVAADGKAPYATAQRGPCLLYTSWRGPAEGDDYYSFYAGCWPPAAQDSDWSHVREAVRVIESYDGTQPLCLYLPLSYPHPPYGVEEPYFSRIDRGLLPPRQPVPDCLLYTSRCV